MLHVLLQHPLKGSGRTRNNYRTAIGTLFSFARSCGYILKGHIDFEDVALAREGHSDIEVFTLEEMTALLTAAQKANFAGQGLLPYLVLGGFAGLRTAEIQGQLWSDINLDRGFIRVTAAKGNTARKRLVPVSDNLKQWLQLCWRDDGVCCNYERIENPVRQLVERSAIQWKRNALRHSFISYRVALTQNIPQVSLEAGNSVGMINKHYRELVTADQALGWFAISPNPGASMENAVQQKSTLQGNNVVGFPLCPSS